MGITFVSDLGYARYQCGIYTYIIGDERAHKQRKMIVEGGLVSLQNGRLGREC